MPKTKMLPPWGRVREVGRSLLRPIAAPGWIALLLKALDWGQRFQFVRGFMSNEAIQLVKDWGWLAGVAWLGLVLLWAAARPSELDRVRAMHRLRDTSRQLALKLDLLFSPSVFTYSMADEPVVHAAVRDVGAAVRSVVVAAIATVPAERRDEYRAVLIDIWADLSEFHPDKKAAAREVTAILEAVDAANRPADPT